MGVCLLFPKQEDGPVLSRVIVTSAGATEPLGMATGTSIARQQLAEGHGASPLRLRTSSSGCAGSHRNSDILDYSLRNFC